MAELPLALDFDANPEATPERMNAAMTNLNGRLAALETFQPAWQALLNQLQQVGLNRLNDALTPVFQELQALLVQYDGLLSTTTIDAGTLDAPNTRIALRRSSVSGDVPTALIDGEIALNEADGLLFWRRPDGTVASLDLTLAALALLAPSASPLFTGQPRAPTAAPGTSTTQIATTAFVAAAISALVNAAPGALDTLKELADALGDDANFATTTATALANRLRFDVAQALTAPQQALARTNIGGTSVGAAVFTAANAAAARAAISTVWEPISSASLAGASSGVIAFPSGYSAFKLMLQNLNPTLVSTLYLQTSSNGGSSYDAGAADYNYQLTKHAGTSVSTSNASSNNIILTQSLAPSARGQFELTMDPGSGTQFPNLLGSGSFLDASTVLVDRIDVAAMRMTAARINAMILAINGGPFVTGDVYLFGRR